MTNSPPIRLANAKATIFTENKRVGETTNQYGITSESFSQANCFCFLRVVASPLAAEVTMPKLVIDSTKPPYTMLFMTSHELALPGSEISLASLVP